MSSLPVEIESSKLIEVEIMGKTYKVPAGLTMLQAMWHTGYELLRGAGCLGGICGACSTTYRTKGDIKIKTCLACQTEVEDGMSFSLVYSYYPNRKIPYDFEKVKDPREDLFRFYPEASLCRNCDACTEACPKGIDVRTGVWEAALGKFKECSAHFLPCVMCSLCVPVCIADIAPNQIGLYTRRSQGIYFTERPPQLLTRIEEINEGKYESEWEELLAPAEGC